MELNFKNLIREKIQVIIDEISWLTSKKKDLMRQYIDPIDDQIDLLKVKILSEWKLDKTETQFFWTTVWSEKPPHATVSQAVKEEINYRQIVIDWIWDPDNIQDLSSKMGMTEEEFIKRYIKRTESKPSVRIYC